MLTGLALFGAGLLSVLAWIGWRFFLMSPLMGVGSSGIHVDDSLPVSRIGVCKRAAVHFIGIVSSLRRTALVSILVVVLMICAVLALSDRISIDPLHALDFQHAQHIQSALNPEKLVAPPALPPSMFVDAERPELEAANRDWARLDPSFAQAVLLVMSRMEARGLPMALLEGYRSPERQNRLASSGMHVTNAKAFQSKHQFGLAVDLAPVAGGRLQISERNPWAMQAYRALGEESVRAGLVWGGNWSLKDYGHIEAAEIGDVSMRN